MGQVKSIFESTQSWAGQRQLVNSTFTEVGSTNEIAKKEAFTNRGDAVLYLAAHQTQGRGRSQNHWLDTGAGESLLSSWSFDLPSPAQAITAPRIGYALYQAVAGCWPGLEWSLKAPNDLYLKDKKLGGLLIETVSQGGLHRLIIGMGLNILNHPRALDTATHLLADSGLGEGLEDDRWYQFLDVLYKNLRSSLIDVVQSHISDDMRAGLLTALNACPVKAQAYKDVSSDGDLTTVSGTTIPWTSI